MELTEEIIRAASGDRDQLGQMLDSLAAEAADGDREALELLVWAIDELNLTGPTVRGLVLNRADAEDVAQDVLVAVAETISGYRGEAHFRTWLNRVAKYKAIAHLRRKRDETVLEDDVSDVFRISSMLASRSTLRDALDGLPAYYQQAVALRDIEQLPYQELAERLGINVNTAKSRVARGRALAAARLAEP